MIRTSLVAALAAALVSLVVSPASAAPSDAKTSVKTWKDRPYAARPNPPLPGRTAPQAKFALKCSIIETKIWVTNTSARVIPTGAILWIRLYPVKNGDTFPHFLHYDLGPGERRIFGATGLTDCSVTATFTDFGKFSAKTR